MQAKSWHRPEQSIVGGSGAVRRSHTRRVKIEWQRVIDVAQLARIAGLERGMPLAYLSGMTRWVGGLTMAVIGLLLVLAWDRHASGAANPPLAAPASSAAASPASAPAAAAATGTDSVRVEHELVQAAAVASPVPARVTLASHGRRAEPRRESRGLVLRASRAIVGDGRYRPEPFPRPATR
jgi:hypothetical protein